MKFINPEIINSLPFTYASITHFKQIKNNFIILTQEGILYRYDENLELERKVQIDLPVSKFSKNYKTLVDFNLNFILCLYNNKIKLFDYSLKEICVVNRTQKDIFKINGVNSLRLIENEIYVGTEEGKCMVFNQMGYLIDTLKSSNDYITYIEGNKKIKTYGTFDGKIVIHNKQNIYLYTINISNEPVEYIEILDNLVICVDRIGYIYSFNILNKEEKKIGKIGNKVLNIYYENNSFIINQLKYGMVIFNKLRKNIKSLIFTDEIKMIFRINNNIYEILPNKIIKNTNINDITSNLLSLKNKSLTQLKKDLEIGFKIIDNNIFLQNKQKYIDTSNKNFDLIINKTMKLIENNQIVKANGLMKIYENIDMYYTTINILKKDKNVFINFKNSYNKKNYHVCYEMAHQISFLKKTIEYKNMEKEFNKIFNTILTNNEVKNNLKKIENLISPFKNVYRKKIYIKYIEEKTNTLEKLIRSIEYKNIVIFYKIITNNKELMELEESKKMINYINNIYKNTRIFPIEEALKNIKKLKLIEKYKKEMIELEKQIEEYKFFLFELKSNKIYNFNINNFFIINSLEYKKIQKEYDMIYKIIRNNIKSFNKTLILKKLKKFNNFNEEDIIKLVSLTHVFQLYSYLENNNKELFKEKLYIYKEIYGENNYYKFFTKEISKKNIKFNNPKNLKYEDLINIPDYL